jgi:hypothetical protein
VGVAKLPLDRFIRLDAGQTAGTVLTKPFQLAGSRLEVNVDARQGEMRVEVLDTMSQPLGGYSGDDAKTYRNINELRLSPRWAKPLSQIVGQSIRLRFHLRNAGLYSFQLQA